MQDELNSIEILRNAILATLDENRLPLKAREVARVLRASVGASVDKRTVNRVLYKLLATGIVMRSEEFRWTLSKPAKLASSGIGFQVPKFTRPPEGAGNSEPARSLASKLRRDPTHEHDPQRTSPSSSALLPPESKSPSEPSQGAWRICVHSCVRCLKAFEHRLNLDDPCNETSYCNDCRRTWRIDTLSRRWQAMLLSLRQGYRRAPTPTLDEYDRRPSIPRS